MFRVLTIFNELLQFVVSECEFLIPIKIHEVVNELIVVIVYWNEGFVTLEHDFAVDNLVLVLSLEGVEMVERVSQRLVVVLIILAYVRVLVGVRLSPAIPVVILTLPPLLLVLLVARVVVAFLADRPPLALLLRVQSFVTPRTDILELHIQLLRLSHPDLDVLLPVFLLALHMSLEKMIYRN